MKKIFGICICLILLVAAIIAPTVAFADQADANVTIHFLNPTAIAYVDGKLFIADNIDENNSAIHCFNVKGNNAQWLYTQPLTEKIVNLSAKDENSLYVVFTSKIVEYKASESKITETATITSYTNPVDVTYGMDGRDGKNEYILTDSELYRNNIGRATTTTISGTKSCIAIGNYVYYLYADNGVDICKTYEGTKHFTPNDESDQGYLNNSDTTSSNYFLKDFGAKGLFVWENDKVAIFSGERICYVSMSETCTLVNIFNYKENQQEQENKKSITDVATSNNRLYVLNDNYQVDIFEKTETSFNLIGTVGDDTVNQSVPTKYTSFTLARSTGYPTNLVYKTTDDQTSVDDIIKNATEYIILGFEGENESLYYYVLVGDKFGWVQKSEGATITNGKITDAKLQIVNTTVSNDYVDVTTRFNSLNAVYIHKLPRESSDVTVFTQTSSTQPDVKVLQQFTEKTGNGDVIWYYVSYENNGETETGFVKKEHVGTFATAIKKNVVTQQKKINSTLFEAVKVYSIGDKELMDDEHLVTNANGMVKLYSGQRVTLINEENGVAYIQISYGDGTNVYGYVFSDRLIGIHAITTNAIVGLTLLAVAIALATTLIVIFVKRKNGTLFKKQKKETPKDE